MVDRNELWAQTEELADLLTQCPELEAYRVAEMNMKNHPEAQSLLRRLRDLHEEIGEFAARNVPEAYYKHLVEESESLLGKLEKIPLVAEFQRAQDAVNELLQAVTNRLAKAVSEDEAPRS